MKIGLSLLCEQPDRKTGLTSLFTCFVREALRCYYDLEVVLFCANGQTLETESLRLTTAGGMSRERPTGKALGGRALPNRSGCSWNGLLPWDVDGMVATLAGDITTGVIREPHRELGEALAPAAYAVLLSELYSSAIARKMRISGAPN